MAEDWAPILVRREELPGGRLRYVWSVRPGRHVTITGPAAEMTADQLAFMAEHIVPALPIGDP